jgi:hypothetical protein
MNVASQIVLKRACLIRTVVTNTPGTGSQYKFNYEDFLRKATIYGIEVVKATELSVDNNGNNVIAADYDLLTITLMRQIDNALIVKELPYNRFDPRIYSGYTQYIEPVKINWEQSYVTLNATPGTIAQGESIPLIVYYQMDEESQTPTAAR